MCLRDFRSEVLNKDDNNWSRIWWSDYPKKCLVGATKIFGVHFWAFDGIGASSYEYIYRKTLDKCESWRNSREITDQGSSNTAGTWYAKEIASQESTRLFALPAGLLGAKIWIFVWRFKIVARKYTLGLEVELWNNLVKYWTHEFAARTVWLCDFAWTSSYKPYGSFGKVLGGSGWAWSKIQTASQGAKRIFTGRISTQHEKMTPCGVFWLGMNKLSESRTWGANRLRSVDIFFDEKIIIS